ncbi:hypothetical protein DW352_05180 [Pseudolabrys taiwanensis]|uniref:Uncharacterized protein n=1 Tax=Pseudolabrys taiwanensis TaxID=331696 RepID=A0A345ZSR5_9HYPH|nr:hypothetical protein DW352_05180 [Pseudolabrys taiwanensis]
MLTADMAKRDAWRVPPPKPEALYGVIWREAETAIRDTFRAHPEHLTTKGRHAAQTSLAKRVTGRVVALLRRRGVKIPNDDGGISGLL